MEWKASVWTQLPGNKTNTPDAPRLAGKMQRDMKNPITNQPSLREAGMKECLAHTNAAVAAGVLAGLLLATTATSAGQGPASAAHTRPIEDFIEAQGVFATVIVPPEDWPKVWATGWSDRRTIRFASVDCWGLANQWIEEQSGEAISLGTEVTGEILERPLAGGRVEVTVRIHTRNALTWVAEWLPEAIPPWGELLFGHFPEEILAGAEPALGESFITWVFLNEAPGAPLPDFFAEVIAGPTVETLMLSIEAHADGPLREAFGVPEGTPGRAQTTQTGRLFPPGLDATLTSGKWPAEHINLKVVGR